MASIRKQIHNNAVALISLAIAVVALGYNTWRNETTEEQRNVRHAAFRVLENLGEMQQIVDFRYYYLPYEDSMEREGELRVRGFGHAAMIYDLMMLMPDPAPGAGDHLYELWQTYFSKLDDLDSEGRHTGEATAAEQELTAGIVSAREAVLRVLQELE